jgi:SAM-dependent methyltransferase
MHASPVEPGQPGYSDAEAAALYNVLNPWGASDDFYLGLVMQARSALDVGCGTGVLLHHARDAGHRGRLCGVDPDPASSRLPANAVTSSGKRRQLPR